MTPVTPALTGPWPYFDYPKEVTMLGRRFERSTWTWEGYPNVVAQYREAVPTNSMHLMVERDGRYRIDHMDAYNPDWGPAQLLLHGLCDILLRG